MLTPPRVVVAPMPTLPRAVEAPTAKTSVKRVRVRLDRLEAAVVLLSLRVSERHWCRCVPQVAL